MNMLNAEDETALVHSVQYGHVDCLKILIDAGVSVNTCDKQMFTSLMWAGNVECVKLLIAAGADVNTARMAIQR